MSAAAPCTPAWAHEIGILHLGPVAEVPSTVEALADRLLIQETASRYALAYDERRLDVIDSLVTDDVEFGFRVGAGPETRFRGRTAVLDWLSDVMASQSDQRRHLIGPVVIDDLTLDTAQVSCPSAIFGIQDEARLVTTTLYVFRLVKSDNRWRIVEAMDGLDRAF